MRSAAAGLLVVLGLVVAGCGDGSSTNDGANPTTATTTVAAGTSTSAAPISTAAQPDPVDPAVPTESGDPAVPVEPQPQPKEEDVASAAETNDGATVVPQEPDPNPFNCVGEICPNPYTDAPAPDPSADPRNPQIVWCGTDKYVHDRGATVWDDGTWSPWTQHCADEFDAVNNPPNPPGTMGGGGAVAGPCRPDEEGTISNTPDMRKQRCTGGQWVFIR